MYKVVMTNFGNVVYEGAQYTEARAAAIRTGFECTITCPDGIQTWSPIGGWRTLYKHEGK